MILIDLIVTAIKKSYRINRGKIDTGEDNRQT